MNNSPIEIKKKNIIGMGFGLEDLAKELEIEEALKAKEKIPVTEDHACAVKKEEQVIDGSTDILNEINLKKVWSKLMDWFEQNEQQNLFELLSENTPKLESKSLFLTLDSAVEKKIIEDNISQIKGFLKRHFIDFENLELTVSKTTKSKKIILNQKDKFIKLAKKNPYLNTLRKELGLELEM